MVCALSFARLCSYCLANNPQGAVFEDVDLLIGADGVKSQVGLLFCVVWPFFAVRWACRGSWAVNVRWMAVWSPCLSWCLFV